MVSCPPVRKAITSREHGNYFKNTSVKQTAILTRSKKLRFSLSFFYINSVAFAHADMLSPDSYLSVLNAAACAADNPVYLCK